METLISSDNIYFYFPPRSTIPTVNASTKDWTGRIKRNPQKSCINRVSCPGRRRWWFGANCGKSGAKRAKLGEVGDTRRSKGKTTTSVVFVSRRNVCSLRILPPSRRFVSFPLKIRPDQRVYAARLWGESSKSILVSTAGGTAWNFGCRCKRDGFESYISNWANGWRGPDIFRSRIPSDRLGRRGLCARPPIKKISPAISCKYFLWRSARLLW